MSSLKGTDDVDHSMNKTPYIEEGLGADLQTEGVGVVDHHAERALCRKFDFRMLPLLALMYLFNALDKGNLGRFNSSLQLF